MAEFHVTWEIDLDADDAAAAARKAWRYMRNEGSIANVFDVVDEHGHTTRVDLEDDAKNEETVDVC
jgi:hypothetical protein